MEKAWKWGGWKVEGKFRTFLYFDQKVALLPSETDARSCRMSEVWKKSARKMCCQKSRFYCVREP